jgi:hypothetical protein
VCPAGAENQARPEFVDNSWTSPGRLSCSEAPNRPRIGNLEDIFAPAQSGLYIRKDECGSYSFVEDGDMAAGRKKPLFSGMKFWFETIPLVNGAFSVNRRGRKCG